MLTNPTIETLKTLKLQGMIQALEEQQQNAAVNALSFEERVALIVDRERLYRDNQRRTGCCAVPDSKSPPPASRISITKPHGALINARSLHSPAATGSSATRTC